MERVTEPELMDEPEQARAYARADFSEPNTRFLELFQEAFPALREGWVVDLGCGPADITVRFVQRFPGCRLHAVDGSAAMLAFAREAVARARVGDRVELVRGRVPETPLPRADYDAVISNSLLHHLHDPAGLWETVRRHARPGAAVLVMDLARPHSEAEVDTLVEIYAADAPPVLRRDFRASLRAAFRVEEVRAQLHAAGLDGMAVRMVSDRHLLVAGRTGGR